MFTIKQLKLFAEAELQVFPEAREETQRLLEHCFGVRRHEVLARSEQAAPGHEAFLELVSLRRTGKPLAHILGYFWFYKHRFPVSPKTLIPRYDSELLVEAALAFKPRRILDVGTGTGVLALSLAGELPEASIIALDIVGEPFHASQKALGLGGVEFIKMDFLNRSLWKNLGSFDMVISNPPYLSDGDMEALDPSVKDWEPASALYGGEDGLVFYRALEEFCQKSLQAGGICLLEVDHKFASVEALFGGYEVSIKKDYAGLERVLAAKKTLS